MHQLSAAGISPEWKISCRLRGRSESLCILSWVCNHRSQERAHEIRHEQGHAPVSSGEAVASHLGAKISEAADGGENATKKQIVRDPSTALRFAQDDKGRILAHPSVTTPFHFRHLTGSDVGFEWTIATDSVPLLLQRNGVVARL
jgi:hypothetical protein